MASTDVFMTAVCWVGSKSLSHVLACIDRTKGRLLDVGAASEGARAQIIASVMDYWRAHPGVAVCIVEKLLNYSVLTPLSVVHWALSGREGGEVLAEWHVFELVANTVAKVTGRARQVVGEGREGEVRGMRELFGALEEALGGLAGRADGEGWVGVWAERWLRVYRRRSAIEEAFVAGVEKAGEGRE